MSDLEDVSDEALERERDRLYDLSQEVSGSLSAVKTELMRRALSSHNQEVPADDT